MFEFGDVLVLACGEDGVCLEGEDEGGGWLVGRGGDGAGAGVGLQQGFGGLETAVLG